MIAPLHLFEENVRKKSTNHDNDDSCASAARALRSGRSLCAL